jgi:polyhydroxyalkanoate synthesis repressor PhaR
MTTTIKRYPNRKLYDTSRKKYITLEGINELIRDGEAIVVLDNVTGEDITAVTLSQVIFENEKKKGGFLSRAVLLGLIQSGGTTLHQLRREMNNAMENLAIDEEIRHRINILVEQGEFTLDQAEVLIAKLLSTGEARIDLISPIEQTVRKVLSTHGIAIREEYQKISKQLEEISSVLDEIEKSDSHEPPVE